MQPYISQSASSRVWSTPELARLIILNLKFRVHHDGYTFGLPKNRSALASLARVNTLTSEIALSVLYQRVDDDSGVGPRAAPTLLNLISILGSLKRCETSGWVCSL
ncbi:hypothetical protein SISSUDRAFT_817372 [Sistotremastrum suecicum HHB10207 ss-3]|uniref:Uncharacterized protein n=1 Tax=Sistotremastrum suecicum HHB10207 ss-3 TaxID=1314776 RepID=A0A166CV55_9AGAM|nr:hypothetical protein SISSUDRAFT_817372 [Sistotremastrum suecicum HHB10207 ss-3]